MVKKIIVKNLCKSNVVEEIKSLDMDKVPQYLYHRYRCRFSPKENFRQLSSYLQIEPTSICNYRCVFCYQTDNVFNKKSNNFMGHIAFETLKNIVDQAEGNIEFISLASRGNHLCVKT